MTHDKKRHSELQAIWSRTPKGRACLKRRRLAVKNRNRSVVIAAKLLAGCCRCGYKKHAAALQFHHRDPRTKLFDVNSYAGKGKAAVIREIEKCDVLCANCHFELHDDN